MVGETIATVLALMRAFAQMDVEMLVQAVADLEHIATELARILVHTIIDFIEVLRYDHSPRKLPY